MDQLYEQLARYYHLLFPARKAQLGFLAGLAGEPPACVLDVASGTGEYVAALTERGYEAWGLELDAAMHLTALARHPQLGLPPVGSGRLIQGDMRDIASLVAGPFDLVYCIGNSLPHLASRKETGEVLAALWRLTAPGGTLALQTVNFERVWRVLREQHKYVVPPMTVTGESGAELRFERCYRVEPAGTGSDGESHLLFDTALTTSQGAQWASTPLLCLRDLEQLVAAHCEGEITVYGDFQGAPKTPNSPATVIVVRNYPQDRG